MNALRDLNWGTFYYFQDLRNERPRLTQALDWLNLLAQPLVLLAFALLAALVLLRRGQPRAARYLLLVTLTSAIVSETLKWTFHWPRPQTWAGPWWQGPSLPSSPALLSFVLCLTLGRFHMATRSNLSAKASTLAAWLLPALLIAFMQLHLLHHWLFDVITAWLIAGIVLSAFETVAGPPILLPSPRTRGEGLGVRGTPSP